MSHQQKQTTESESFREAMKKVNLMEVTVDFSDVNTSQILSVQRLESEIDRNTKEEYAEFIAYQESLVLNAYLLACCDHDEDYAMPGAQIRPVYKKISKRPTPLVSLLKKGTASKVPRS
jgi:hypothetical protein